MDFPTDWPYTKKIVINSGMVDGSSDISNYELVLNESILSTAQKTELFGNSQGKEIYTNWLYGDSGLVSYWRLEDLTDSIGSNTLTATNSPTNEAARFGNGYTFVAGSSQKLQTGTGASDLNITGSQTWSFWTKPTVASGRAGAMSIFESGVGERKLWIESSLTVYFRINGLSTDTINVAGFVKQSSWYHLVGVYDADEGYLRIYINGQKMAEQAVTGTPTSLSTNQMTFANDNGTSYHSCQQDDMAFFNRALDDTEVYALYTGGADVRFFIESGGNRYTIPHAMIDWDTDAETFASVVRLPTIYDASDTELGIAVGDTDATPLGRELVSFYDLYNDANLMAYWRFENDLTDEQGNNDATGINTPTYSAGKLGTYGLELESSSSQCAYIADNTYLSITGDMTVGAWIKMESISSDMTVIAKDDVGTANRCWSLVILSTGKLRFATFGSGSTSTRWDSNDGDRLSKYVGKWVHVAASIDVSASAIKLYINGIEVGAYTTTISTATDIVDGSNRVLIGARDNSGTPEQFFDGTIDDLFVFNRQLTDVEIAGAVGHHGGAFRELARGFWGFNNNGKDLTIYGNDFTSFNGHSVVSGAFGYAIDFERDNSEYWTIPSGSQNGLAPSTSTDRMLTLYGKNESIEYSKNENMFGWLNAANNTGFHWRVAQNTRTYGITDPASGTFFVTNANNTLRMADDFAFDRTGTWVFQAGGMQATTSSGQGVSFADGTASTDTHTATPSDLSSIGFSAGRSGDYAGNYGDFSIDLGAVYHEYLSVDYLGTQHENIDNMTTHITVTNFYESDERDTEVAGKLAVNNERDTEILGKVNATDERDTEIEGIRNYSDRDTEITGAMEAEVDERDTEITGLIPSDERDTEIIGLFDDGDERDTQIYGKQSVTDERDTEIEGSLPFSTRNTQIIGKAEKDLPRTYRIIVKDGSGNNVGEFEQFRTLKFGKRLNNYGMASFEVPVTDSKASDLISLRVYTVWIYRQENATSTLVWAGEQAMRDVELDDNGAGWVTVYCYTWFEQLKDRYTDEEELYDAQDAGAIAWDLIDTTQTGSNASFGITQGSITTTVDRDRSYYNQNIMEAIINLANVIDGFDFEITDEKVFNVYDIMGDDKTDDVMFEYGTNISSIRITEDFVTPINRGIVLGVATDQTTLQRVVYNDAGLQATNKIREGVLNEMDVSESQTLSDKGEAMVRKYGTKLIKVEPKMTKSAAISITDFGLGDVIRLVIEHGIYDIDEDYRVFEWEVTYNSDNSEDLALVLGNFTI